MYVCICNALTDRRIRGAIEDGAASVGAVYRDCGVAPRCGRCSEMIRGYLNSNRTEAELPEMATPCLQATG